jgi:hypothetical protein
MAKILDEYMQDFQQRNSTLRVFLAYLSMNIDGSKVLMYTCTIFREINVDRIHEHKKYEYNVEGRAVKVDGLLFYFIV